MECLVVWEAEGAYREFTGVISGGEILEANLELYADPRFKNASYLIDNYSEISGSTVESPDLEALGVTDEIISKEYHDIKIALIVAQEPREIDMAKSYCDQMKDKGFKYEYFLTVDNARKWATNKL